MKLFDLDLNAPVVITDPVEKSFKSKAQQKFMFAASDRGEISKETVEEFAHKTKDISKLPEHVKKGEDEDVKKSVHAWSQQPGNVRVIDADHGRALVRPQSANNLFPMVEGDVHVYSRSPIQQQRANDGTPHTVGGVTGLRPPEPELYLSKAFANPDVPAEANALNNPTSKIEPNKIVKAFLEG
jgi:hypothetical protein